VVLLRLQGEHAEMLSDWVGWTSYKAWILLKPTWGRAAARWGVCGASESLK
jgi:hypothetical protein